MTHTVQKTPKRSGDKRGRKNKAEDKPCNFGHPIPAHLEENAEEQLDPHQKSDEREGLPLIFSGGLVAHPKQEGVRPDQSVDAWEPAHQRTVITDKTNDPKWDPATPAEVSEELIDSIFAPLPDNEEWKPL